MKKTIFWLLVLVLGIFFAVGHAFKATRTTSIPMVSDETNQEITKFLDDLMMVWKNGQKERFCEYWLSAPPRSVMPPNRWQARRLKFKDVQLDPLAVMELSAKERRYCVETFFPGLSDIQRIYIKSTQSGYRVEKISEELEI